MSTPNSITSLEADIAARRERLALTVDELARRAAPKAIARRQANAAKTRFTELTTDEDGNVRTETIAALALAAVALIGIGLTRRRRG